MIDSNIARLNWMKALEYPLFRFRCLTCGLLGCLYCGMLPLAVFLTEWANDSTRLPLSSEMAWTCVPAAQTVLAMLYLAFGGSTIAMRLPIAILAFSFVLFGTTWAYDFLDHQSPWTDLPAMSVNVFFPALVASHIMLLLRPWVGNVGWGLATRNSSFRIADLLVYTLFIALLTSWYQYAKGVPSAKTYSQGSLVLSYVVMSAFGMCCLLLALGTSFKRVLIGGVGLVFALATLFYIWSEASWFDITAPWLIVLGTLLIVRTLGIRLRGVELARLDQNAGGEQRDKLEAAEP